jgi:TetR/AcrR family transcriptional regulator
VARTGRPEVATPGGRASRRRGVVVRRTSAPADARGATAAGAAKRPPRGDVRARILRAAAREIAARGFDGMTLQAVADAVGIRKPSVLHHFPSKEALRQAVLTDFWRHWSEGVPRLLRSATDHSNRFEKTIGELIHFFHENPDRSRVLIRETLDRPREFRALFREYVQPWLVMIGNNIRDGQQRGMYHASLDPEQHLLQILELVLISTAWGDISAEGTAPESKRHLDAIVHVARNSLFLRPAEAAPPTERPRRRRT